MGPEVVDVLLQDAVQVLHLPLPSLRTQDGILVDGRALWSVPAVYDRLEAALRVNRAPAAREKALRAELARLEEALENPRSKLNEMVVHHPVG